MLDERLKEKRSWNLWGEESYQHSTILSSLARRYNICTQSAILTVFDVIVESRTTAVREVVGGGVQTVLFGVS